jgi:predicted phosphoribosyltransferase
MVIAAEVARELELPLDVLTVRKLGTPGHEELAMGAIASGGAVVLDHSIIDSLRIPEEDVEREIRAELDELNRREDLYRDDGGPLPLEGRNVIVVDDGAATGTTVLSAIETLRSIGVKTVVVAVPVASRQAKRALEKAADRTVCALVPPDFYAVGMWFGDFRPVSNKEVQNILREARERSHMHGEDRHD